MKYTLDGSILYPEQLEFVKAMLNEKQHAINIKSRGGGKSFENFYLANAYVVKNLVAGKIKNVLICATEKIQTREIYAENIMHTGNKMFDILPPFAKYVEYKNRISYQYNAGSRTIRSSIVFGGSDNYESLRGGRYDLIIGDEFARWKPEAFQAIWGCLRQNMQRQIIGKFVGISTVNGENHVYDMFKKYKDDPKWYVKLRTCFDLGMTQEEYDALPMSENMKRQEFLCDWHASADGAVFSSPKIDDSIAYNPNYPVYGALDIGGQKDYMAAVFGQKINGKLFILNSFRFVGSEINQSIIDKTIDEIYKYLKHINCKEFLLYLPHDANVKELMSIETRMQRIANSGIPVELLSKRNIIECRDFIRTIWHTIYFKSGELVESLKQYKIDQTTGLPKHDKFSHEADALSYLVLGTNQKEYKNRLTYYHNTFSRRAA